MNDTVSKALKSVQKGMDSFTVGIQKTLFPGLPMTMAAGDPEDPDDSSNSSNSNSSESGSGSSSENDSGDDNGWTFSFPPEQPDPITFTREAI